MTTDHSYQNLLSSLANFPLTIFCGAGISYNSGLPVVYQFTEAIFDQFNLSNDERRVFHESVYPFEAFMELLENESDIQPLLETFRMGGFNTNHLLIAKLVKAGRVRNIVTTNFDLLIEQALLSIGYSENQDFIVYKAETEFSQIRWESNFLNLIKIHGSVSDFESMAINMRLVARQENCENKNQVIRELFDKQLNPLVLILGYSCSDIFDISPIIETIKDNQSEVILLEHFDYADCRMESLTVKYDKNPFTEFTRGTRIFCHADRFLQAVWDVNQLGSYESLQPHKPNWKENIKRWYVESVTNNSAGFLHQICGRLFDDLCSYDLSIKHYEKAINIALGLSDNLRIGSELGNLGVIYNKIDKYDDALKCLNTSLGFCRRLNNIQGQICQLQAIGNTYRNLAKYDDAVKAMSEAITLIRSEGTLYDLCTTLGNLVLIHNLTQDYQQAIITAEEALTISRRLGVKNSEGSHLSSLGVACFSTGQILKGIDCLRQSLYINRQIGHETNICNSLCNLAKLLKDSKQYDEALSLLTEAFDLASKLSLQQAKGLIWLWRGEISLKNGRRVAAKAEMLQALEIFTSIFQSDHPFVMVTIGALLDANFL